MFQINNLNWNLFIVEPCSPMLRRSDGSYTVGMTDRATKNIYISELVYGNFFDKVLCHELCHAFCLSYGLSMDIGTEEIIADFLATYGKKVFAVAEKLMREFLARVA